MLNKYFDINESDLSLRCKLYYNPQTKIKNLVLFGHGFGGHKENKAAEKFSEKLLSKEKNCAVITFDWPCHGKDNYPRLSLDICDKYLNLLLDYFNFRFGLPFFLKEEDPLSIYYYGVSFGGYLALKYIHEHSNPFKKIALRCPAVNMINSLSTAILNEDTKLLLSKGKDVLAGFDRKIKINQIFLDELYANDISKYDFLNYADDIMIIQGTKDEIVSFEDSKNFCDSNIIEFIEVDGADHRFTDPKKMDYAISEIIKFFFK